MFIYWEDSIIAKWIIEDNKLERSNEKNRSKEALISDIELRIGIERNTKLFVANYS